jgi:hypothetical protein
MYVLFISIISNRVMLLLSDVHSCVGLFVLLELLRFVCDCTSIVWQIFIKVFFVLAISYIALFILHRQRHTSLCASECILSARTV